MWAYTYIFTLLKNMKFLNKVTETPNNKDQNLFIKITNSIFKKMKLINQHLSIFQRSQLMDFKYKELILDKQNKTNKYLE